MRRILWLVIALATIGFIQSGVSSGEAKTQPYIISGGVLGEGAVSFYPDDGWYGDGWVSVDAPATEPAGPRYELYISNWGPIEMAVFIAEGPLEVLYPEDGLRHVLKEREEGWYELSESNVAFLTWLIGQAEIRKEFGTLPQSVLHAYAEAHGIEDSQVKLFGGFDTFSRVSVDGMDLLLSLLTRRPAGTSDQKFQYIIQGRSNNTPVYGYYDPPTATGPGRIRANGPSPGTNFPVPYFETTAAFDKLIADAIRATEPTAEPEQQLEPARVSDVQPIKLATDDGGAGPWRWTTIGLAGLVVAMFTASAATLATRRHKKAG